MKNKDIYLGESKLKHDSDNISGQVVKLDGESYYEIANYDHMPDFFMTIVSDSDHWMYISSNGSLTAGRKNRNNALFPYYTVDKIHDYKNITGSKTTCLVEKDGKTKLWEPFLDSCGKVYRLERRLYKSVYGNKIIFEENNLDLGLCFQYAWCNSERFGWIKKSRLSNISEKNIAFCIIDGLSNILPCGIDYDFQNEYSNLLDAYKRNELLEESKLGLYTLSSIPVDKAEPSEALKATTVWSLIPFSSSGYLLSEKQLARFKSGEAIETETDIKATRGAYFVNLESSLEHERSIDWYIVAEINQDSSDVANLDDLIINSDSLELEIENDIRKGTANLKRIVGGADGIQQGRDKLVLARHFSNTLFNAMRGGVFTDSYTLDTRDVILYVKQCNSLVYNAFKADLSRLPDSINYAELIQWSAAIKNPELERICYEYLPLTFSRRHGDPSRPWNQFSIETKNEDGSKKLSYEGNWRDIFQNWEALGLSFPEYIESIISKFVNASTADGYNPYRITREGLDWEIPDPDDSWSFIGYWNDHQIIYLQKFLEQSDNYHPGKLDELLAREIFVYANVPYRIKTFDEIINNPKDTIVFDFGLNKRINETVKLKGADGKILHGPDGKIYRVNLLEKILCSLLAKLSNFIPGAGIWLNTQRPEWNDANNALVGNGASMVTLYYLRRFLTFWKRKFELKGTESYLVSVELVKLFNDIFSLFSENTGMVDKGFTSGDRYNFTESLGRAGSTYRQSVYTDSFSGEKELMSVSKLLEFLKLSLLYVDNTIKANRRDDGLYHAYNLISIKDKEISLRTLYEMLEGQVAVLSSGYLNSSESLEVLDAMKASKLFRQDQYSYLLYPNRELPRFREKNTIPEKQFKRSQLLQKLVAEEDLSIIRKDNKGTFHFNGDFRNVNDLSAALDSLDSTKFSLEIEGERGVLFEIFESVFDHQSFTGRSGTFYGYEGLGSIYWHMVSKLLLATQECYLKGYGKGDDPVVLGKLKDHYYEIKAGIGIYKSPGVYGAFPTDAYSHTPSGSGAKQPGLTGQVKEDIISRFGEFGVRVTDGKIEFSPSLLNENEVLQDDDTYEYVDLAGNTCTIELKSNQIAFTYCQVPVIYSAGSRQQLIIEFNDGSKEETDGNIIDIDTCQKIFTRSGEVRKIEYYFKD